MNVLTLAGNLGQEPEMKYTPSGMAVCECSIATTYFMKKEKHTEWTPFVLFDKKAESFAKHAYKGQKVCISGEKRTETWTDKDGNKKQKVKCIAYNFTFQSTNSDNSSKNTAVVNKDNGSDFNEFDDDIPF